MFDNEKMEMLLLSPRIIIKYLGLLVDKTLLGSITKLLDLFQNYGTPYLVIYFYIFAKH